MSRIGVRNWKVTTDIRLAAWCARLPLSGNPGWGLGSGDWLGRDLWAGHWCTTHGIRRDICLLGLENGLDGFPNPFDFFKDVFW